MGFVDWSLRSLLLRGWDGSRRGNFTAVARAGSLDKKGMTPRQGAGVRNLFRHFLATFRSVFVIDC